MVAFPQAPEFNSGVIDGCAYEYVCDGRSFGIQQMVKWQVDIALVRDLTDAMYNPADPPHVSHDRGTELMIEYIEKYWCPSIPADCLLKNYSSEDAR